MTSGRFRGDLLSPEEVGETAAQRTLSRLGATVPKTTQVPVVFSPMMGGRIMGAVSNALNGYSLVNKASFLLDSLGESVGSELVTLTDDATIDRGLGSRPFDGEGLPARKNVLLEKGVVKSYLLDSYTGRKLGMPSTHNASRSLQSSPSVSPSNLCLAPGNHGPDEIISTVTDGLYVTELFGFGVNGITGDYSQGAAGFWIREGKIAEPVHEFTIAGNLKTILKSIDMVGNDPHLQSSVRCPTFKVAELMVAGR
jgi:PmbA protein